MLISISGLDGAGKTTQIKLLLSYYQKIGLKTASIYDLLPDIRYHSFAELQQYYAYLSLFDVVHLRFRLNSDENNDIMNILEYSDFNDKYLAEASALQGFYDYYLLQKYIINPLLNQGKIIISDRHYYDEIAFKSVYGCDYYRMCKMYEEIPKPDIAFYLSIPSITAYERNLIRPDGKTSLYRNLQNINKLVHFFQKLVQSTNLIQIDGMKDIDEIHYTLLKNISDLIIG